MNPKLPSGAEADDNALAKTATVRIRDVPLAAISVMFATSTLIDEQSHLLHAVFSHGVGLHVVSQSCWQLVNSFWQAAPSRCAGAPKRPGRAETHGTMIVAEVGVGQL